MAEMVSQAVDSMKHSLVEILLQAENAEKYGGELETMATRIEGRVTRAREQQESMLYSMKNDQDRFQADIQSTPTNLLSIHNQASNMVARSVNNGGASSQGAMHTPNKGIVWEVCLAILAQTGVAIEVGIPEEDRATGDAGS